MIGLLVCDDSAEARAGLRTMLAGHGQITIVGEATNGREAIARTLQLSPDVVLMDLGMPVMDGIETTRELVRLAPSTRVVALSGADDEESIDAMLAAGAAAYCVKGAPLWELERAIAGDADPLVRLAYGLASATNWVPAAANGAAASVLRRGSSPYEVATRRPDSRGARVLFVDDDPALLRLLRATFELVDIEIAEARTGSEAAAAISARPPDVVVLDIGLPDVSGLTLCRELKSDPATSWIGIVLLTGAGAEAEAPGRAAGADAFLHKPFSPLELLAVVERLAGGLYDGPFRAGTDSPADEQLLLYASDLRRLLEIERGRQELLQRNYRQTVAALAGALETKDVGTASHSQRVQRYAVELARTLDPSLLDHPSVEHGFLLHDVGKIGIPDHVLQKRGPLDDAERQLMRSHTVLGEQLLGDVDLLHGEGLKVVRGHHERWDGLGYPDGLAGEDIPLAARVFAVADALDAITSTRPYRAARTWDEAAAEILRERGRQFDPDVVDAFREREPELREIRRVLTAA